MTPSGVPHATTGHRARRQFRSNIDNIVGCHHGFFVMFHHNQLPKSPHLRQRLNETGVITLVETDSAHPRHRGPHHVEPR